MALRRRAVLAPKALYGSALARVHAEGFEPASLAALPALRRCLRRAPEGSVLELGSGAGGVLAALKADGFAIRGLEPSPAFRRLARARHGALPLRPGTVDTAPAGPWAAILALGEVLNYRSPEGTIDPWAKKLRRLARSLMPGGVLLFDLMVQGLEPLPSAGWRQEEGWFVAFRFSEKGRHGQREIVTFHKEAGAWRRDAELHRVDMPTVAELEKALQGAGLVYQLKSSWGRFALPPRRLAVEAWRRG